MGGEGAGVVLEVGPGVSGLAVGDRVMGLLTGGFGPVAVADHRLVARVPDGLVVCRRPRRCPIVFLTAYYGLVDLAALKQGERAAGARGGRRGRHGRCAAGQASWALRCSPRRALRSGRRFGRWGWMRRISPPLARSSSRSDSSSETDGRGMDVVLDSLAGSSWTPRLTCWEGGRFLEMGKTDIRDPGRSPSTTRAWPTGRLT